MICIETSYLYENCTIPPTQQVRRFLKQGMRTNEQMDHWLGWITVWENTVPHGPGGLVGPLRWAAQASSLTLQ